MVGAEAQTGVTDGQHGGGMDGMDSDLLGMDGVAGVGDDGVESVVVVSGVVHSAGGAVGLDERVFTLDDVAVALLSSGFHVAGVAVMDSVFERVLGVGLEH